MSTSSKAVTPNVRLVLDLEHRGEEVKLHAILVHRAEIVPTKIQNGDGMVHVNGRILQLPDAWAILAKSLCIDVRPVAAGVAL